MSTELTGRAPPSQVAMKLGATTSALCKRAKPDCEMQCFQKVRVQRMSAGTRKARHERCVKVATHLVLSRVLAKANRLNLDRVVFSDEKIFKMNPKVAPQKHLVWVAKRPPQEDSRRRRGLQCIGQRRLRGGANMRMLCFFFLGASSMTSTRNRGFKVVSGMDSSGLCSGQVQLSRRMRPNTVVGDLIETRPATSR